MNRDGARWWLLSASWALGLGLCAFLVIGQQASIDRPLNWDEVDYVVAARRGIVANYLERGSLSVVQFVELARAKRGANPAALEALARSLPPEDESLPNLRHNHPPLLTYLLAPWTSGTATEERNVRWAYCGLILLLVAGVWIRWGLGLGAIGLILLFVSDAATRTFATINFHIMLAMAVAALIGVLATILRGVRSGTRSEVPIALCAAFVLLSLETGVIVLGLVGLAFFLSLAPWRSLGAARAFALGALRYGIWTLVLFWLLWPGSVRTGAPVTTHLRLLYQVFFVANDDFSRIQSWKAWQTLIANDPFFFAFLAVGTAVLARRFEQTTVPARVAFVAGFGYCLAITPFLAEVRYAFPGLLVLTIATIELLNTTGASERASARLVAYGLACAVLIAGFVRLDPQRLRQEAMRERTGLERVLAAVRAVDPSKGPLLVDGAHIFRYYDPTLNIEKLDMLPLVRGGGLFVRRNYEYVNVDDEAGRQQYSAIVRQEGAVTGFGTRPPLPPGTRAIVDREYPRQDIVEHYWIAQSR